MTTVIMTVAEAIDACADYVEGNSRFDFKKRAFVFTGAGWGAPAIIREAMTHNYMKAHDAYVALRDKPEATEIEKLALVIAYQRLEKISRVREACRQEGFIQALATGALKVEGQRTGESFHRVIKPKEASTFRYSVASNSAEAAQQLYTALKFIPAEKPIRGRGRPTTRPQMAAIFEESRGELEGLGLTAVGRRVADELYQRTKVRVKPDTVSRALQELGCIPVGEYWKK